IRVVCGRNTNCAGARSKLASRPPSFSSSRLPVTATRTLGPETAHGPRLCPGRSRMWYAPRGGFWTRWRRLRRERQPPARTGKIRNEALPRSARPAFCLMKQAAILQYVCSTYNSLAICITIKYDTVSDAGFNEAAQTDAPCPWTFCLKELSDECLLSNDAYGALARRSISFQGGLRGARRRGRIQVH